jgi:hypothetical protein
VDSRLSGGVLDGDAVQRLEALAQAAAEKLVSAMATDAWNAVRTRIAAVVGLEQRMNSDHDCLEKISPDRRDDERDRQAIAWRTRLSDILEARPELAAQLGEALAAQASSPSQSIVTQRAFAGSGSTVTQSGRDSIHGGRDVFVNSPVDKRKDFRLGFILNFAKAHPVVAAALAVVVVGGGSLGVANALNEVSGPQGGAANLPGTIWRAPDAVQWSVVPMDRPIAASSGSTFESAACGSPADCWALGTSNGETIAAHYTGHSWTIVTDSPLSGPTTGGSSIVCPDRTNCYAIVKQMFFHFDGTEWRQQGDAGAQGFNALACPTADECWAIAGANILRLDAGSWNTLSALPAQGQFTAVSCGSRNDCWTVGVTDSLGAVVLHYDGRSWNRVPALESMLPQGGFIVAWITCASESECWLGGYGSTIETATVWHLSTTDMVLKETSFPDRGLYKVSCVSAKTCWAAGGTVGNTPAVDYWDGKAWRAEATSAITAIGSGTFVSLTCAAVRCLALGSTGSNEDSSPMVMVGTPS